MKTKIILAVLIWGGLFLYLLLALTPQNKLYGGRDDGKGKSTSSSTSSSTASPSLLSPPLDLPALIALANLQCDAVRKGRLDLDPTDELKELTPGKLAKFKVPLRLPTVAEAAERRQRQKDERKESLLLSPVSASPRFKDMEFGCFSQNTEDGILLAIFWAIGVSSSRVVEICSGVGWENNAATLVLHFGFEGILMDGRERNVLMANRFFAAHPNSAGKKNVKLLREFITAENVNDLIKRNGFEGEIDLFSLDMDGMDYWIWDALSVVRPRVVVVEIQEVWGWTEYETRPYRADHVSRGIPEMGASIMAFVHLAEQRGYRLVGCMELGFNAFFVRKDLGVDELGGEYDPKGCFFHWKGDWVNVMKERRQIAEKVEWVDPRKTTRQNSVLDAKIGGS